MLEETMQLAKIAFWVSALVVGYTYIGYPVLLWLWARLWPRDPVRSGRLPRVSVVCVAQDEEKHIDARIQNLLALDYPRELLEIVIASDGSSDSTVARANAWGVAGVRVLA